MLWASPLDFFEMKKLFAQNPGSDYVGKVIKITRYQVTVEEVIAEGE